MKLSWDKDEEKTVMLLLSDQSNSFGVSTNAMCVFESLAWQMVGSRSLYLEMNTSHMYG